MLLSRFPLLLGMLFMLCCVLSSAIYAQTLILVSLDGFRHDYLDRFDAPHLNAIAKEGFRVRRLEPVYPPNTFPAHLSLITGLPPQDHGIVDNHFCHEARGDCYHMGDGGKDPSWLKGVPLWNLVEAHGLRSATYFWPESDARWGGDRPSYYLPYQKRAPYDERVDQVLSWLSLPKESRPRFVTLYFSAVDSAGHYHGPDSAETEAAVAEVDRQIGRLWRGLQAIDVLDWSLMVVSDHGMSAIRSGDEILASELPEPAGFERMVSYSRVRYFVKDSDNEQRLAAASAQLGRDLDTLAAGRWQTLNRDEAIALGGADQDTAGRYTLIARPPHFFSRKLLPAGSVQGTHGYPLDVSDMAAFAIGTGTAFKSGIMIDSAHQLDIYPVAAAVLGLTPLTPLPSDGGHLRGALH